METIEDTEYILVTNGMFRNRDPPDLAKPISGSNVDCADQPGELENYAEGIKSWIEEDQMQSLREGFPEDYPDIGHCPSCGAAIQDCDATYSDGNDYTCPGCGRLIEEGQMKR